MRDELNDIYGKTQYIWIEHLFEDSKGNLWIRLARSYCILPVNSTELIKFPYNPGKSPNTFRYLENFAEDRLGRVWLASVDGGLGMTHPDSLNYGVIRKFTVKDGLADNKIKYIEADREGNIWILTSMGLSKLDPDSLTFENFDREYGIPDGNFLQLLSTGEMAIGVPKKGIFLFRPEQIRNNQEQPVPFLTSFKIFDQDIELRDNLMKIDKLDLGYQENFFSFEFSSIAYTLPEKVKYAYRLEGIGFEDIWHYTSDRRYATYTNVPGGDYTLHIKAANNTGTWNENIYNLDIHIATPYWKTLWFQAVVILLVLLLGYWIYQNRIGQIKKSERMKTDFEKRLANVEMSALRAQMNPHFIFNSLNSIDYYIVKNESVKASEYLNRFSRLIRLILQNSRSNYINLKDELEALKLYMEMESLRFNGKFEYAVKVEKGLDLETIEIPPMLFQPYVENAIWHGLMHKQGPGKVELNITKNNGYIECIIQDDGVGRKKAAEYQSNTPTRKKSMGMRITKDRINMINKLYDSNTTVNIIDKTDEDGNPTGTIVELRIPV